MTLQPVTGPAAEPGTSGRPLPRVGFLYNHDVPHQIRHTAPIIGELVGLAEVTVLTSSETQEAEVRRLLPAGAAAATRFIRLQMSPLMRLLRPLGDRVAPFSRLAMLKDNLALFAGFDALVVPETTTTFLKSRFGLDWLKLIYLPHGIAAGAPGSSAPTRLFDLVLLPGPLVRDKMVAAGLVTAENSRIVGYPKFDTVDRNARRRFFADDKPVVLYNPHFNPYLSSWYSMGEDVVRHFAGQDRFNLIVAPHVMLARRRIHISLTHRLARWRKDLPRDLLRAPNIVFDFGSPNSIDMTYTLAADIYLGDVSSQIYEWIIRPRPAIFLRAHGDEPAQSRGYLHWPMGQTVDRVADLPAALARALPFDEDMRQLQEKIFAANFSLTAETSARRAAREIARFLQ
jgi:hypothetical protein